MTGGVAIGSQRLYDAVGGSAYRFEPVVLYPFAARPLGDRRISSRINSALEVDLFGQAYAEMGPGGLMSGPGGASDFARAAWCGGRPTDRRPARLGRQGRRQPHRRAERRRRTRLARPDGHRRRRHRVRRRRSARPRPPRSREGADRRSRRRTIARRLEDAWAAARGEILNRRGNVMAKRKVIISCAVTGSIHTPSMSPHLPVTAEEIADVRARRRGSRRGDRASARAQSRRTADPIRARRRSSRSSG